MKLTCCRHAAGSADSGERAPDRLPFSCSGSSRSSASATLTHSQQQMQYLDMKWVKYALGQEPKVLTSVSSECANGDCDKCPGIFNREDYPNESVFCIHPCHEAQNDDSYVPLP